MNPGRRARSMRAFTLTEMLLVIVIIGVLAGALVVSLSGRSQEARLTRAQSDISAKLSLALDLFEQDCGRFPTTEEGLEALVTDPGINGWKGPYLRGGLKPDPWGTPYSYSHDSDDATQYEVSSAGPDLQFGTEDDVTDNQKE